MTVGNIRSKAGSVKEPYFIDNLIASTGRILLDMDKHISNMNFHQVEYSLFFFLSLPIYMLEGEVLILGSRSTWPFKQQQVICSIQTSDVVTDNRKGKAQEKL